MKGETTNQPMEEGVKENTSTKEEKTAQTLTSTETTPKPKSSQPIVTP